MIFQFRKEEKLKMCGIIGEFSKKTIDLGTFIEMRDELKHRGPDDKGLYVNQKKNIAIGHRRLSIIDLSPSGKQPMCNEDESIWITLNGEIYNYQYLKNKLIQVGHIFKTQTDTEVIIHGYEEWGQEVLNKLIGMFSFCIFDEKKELFFIARDRVGIKPLHYYYNNGRFIFASEIKAIIKDKKIERIINLKALNYYFLFGYIPNPYSIWENIYKLPPGTFLTYKNGKISIKKYWDIKIKSYHKNEEKIIEKTKELFFKSIKRRFISDVPVGILLSGGIDSSLVSAFGSRVNKDVITFSIGFEPKKFSELKDAKIVSNFLKLKNIDNILSQKNIDSYLDKILYYYDEPLGVSSVFPTFLLMSTIKKEKFKVVLSGDGGDEIFAGYKWYSKFEFLRKFDIIKPLLLKFKPFLDKIIKLLPFPFNRFAEKNLNVLVSSPLKRFNYLNDLCFDFQEIKKLINNNSTSRINHFMKQYVRNDLKSIKDLQYLDIKTFLTDHILTKVDRASMANSIEVRVPFLDYKLIEYVLAIDNEIIFKNKTKKYLLKKIASNLLPKEILRKKKKGFSAPLDVLGFIDKYVNQLQNSMIINDGIINGKFVIELLKDIKKNSRKIWFIILFELWYRKWKN